MWHNSKSLIIIFVITAFFIGAFVGGYKHKLVKFTHYIAASKKTSQTIKKQPVKDNYLNNYFVEPLYKKNKFLFPKIRTEQELETKVKQMLCRNSDFFTAYDSLSIKNSKLYKDIHINEYILKVDYQLKNNFSSFAYYKQKITCISPSKLTIASLIIPGTGKNQSSRIFYSDKNKYHFNIDDQLIKFSDVYIYTKPNEDFLAIQNGQNKLYNGYIVNTLINNGGSYSALYLINCLAIIKYLQTKYDKVVVIGLSQGGQAAYLTAMQSQPDIAVVASGYSILVDNIANGTHSQIIIPQLNSYFGKDKAKVIISKLKTQFIFSYGKLEHSLYSREYKNKLTETFFKNVNNTHFFYHNKGHEFPEKINCIIEKYLK